jgi:hypothetical protein
LASAIDHSDLEGCCQRRRLIDYEVELAGETHPVEVVHCAFGVGVRRHPDVSSHPVLDFLEEMGSDLVRQLNLNVDHSLRHGVLSSVRVFIELSASHEDPAMTAAWSHSSMP